MTADFDVEDVVPRLATGGARMQAPQVDAAARQSCRKISNSEPGLSSMLKSRQVTSAPERLAGRGAAIAKRILISATSPTFSRSTASPCSLPVGSGNNAGAGCVFLRQLGRDLHSTGTSITLTRGSSESRKPLTRRVTSRRRVHLLEVGQRRGAASSTET